MTPSEPLMRDTCEEDRETILQRLAELEPEGHAARLLTVRSLLTERARKNPRLRPFIDDGKRMEDVPETRQMEPDLIKAMNRVDEALSSFRMGAGAQTVCQLPRPIPEGRGEPAIITAPMGHQIEALGWLWVVLLTIVTAASAAIMVARIVWI